MSCLQGERSWKRSKKTSSLPSKEGWTRLIFAYRRLTVSYIDDWVVCVRGGHARTASLPQTIFNVDEQLRLWRLSTWNLWKFYSQWDWFLQFCCESYISDEEASANINYRMLSLSPPPSCLLPVYCLHHVLWCCLPRGTCLQGKSRLHLNIH